MDHMIPSTRSTHQFLPKDAAFAHPTFSPRPLPDTKESLLLFLGLACINKNQRKTNRSSNLVVCLFMNLLGGTPKKEHPYVAMFACFAVVIVQPKQNTSLPFG